MARGTGQQAAQAGLHPIGNVGALGREQLEGQGLQGVAGEQRLGLAFQVVDDILDVTADSATLGKTAGKDAANDKPTYVSLLGLDGSRALARSLLDEALSALGASGLPDTRALAALARMVVVRDN